MALAWALVRTYLADFQLRKYIGDQHPFYANLGIAQIEQLLDQGKSSSITELIKKTETDGLIVHVNPLQEWIQPEGDRINASPIETLKKLLDTVDCSIVVKEVGQGMGTESLRALFELPIDGVDFGAHGGTNFSAMELYRANQNAKNHFSGLANIGHNADQMVDSCNKLIEENPAFGTKHIIISGGVRSFLDGYYHQQRLNALSVYAQASSLLKHAEVGFDKLDEYIEHQMEGYRLAQSYLTVKDI